MKYQKGMETAHKAPEMKTSRSTSFLRLTAACLATVLVTASVACSKKSSDGGSSGGGQQQTGGDGSGGGNTSTTKPELVRDQVNKIRPRLLTILNRMRAWKSDDQYRITLKNIDDFFADPELENIIKTMKINVQDAPCNPPGVDEKAGFGYPKTKTICLSIEELAKLPEESHAIEIDALAFHEIGHLTGQDEYVCQALQKFLIDQPWIVDLANTHIGPMLDAYDSAINSLDHVIAFADHHDRMDTCRAVSSYETLMKVLDQALDVPAGSMWRHAQVPQALKPDTFSPEMLPALNWGNDVCDQKAWTTADRIKNIEIATAIGNHLMDRRVKLALYQSEDDVYAAFPTILGAAEVTFGPVRAAIWKAGMKGAAAYDRKKVSCKLTDLAAGAEVTLSPSREQNHEGDLVATVLDQAGVERPLEVNFLDFGLALIQTSFSKTDVHLISAPANARTITYFTSVHGIYQPFASLEGYRSFKMDLFLTDRFTSFKTQPTGKTYRLECQTK